MAEGIGDEVAGIDLGDERLNRRSRQLLESLAANPEASINAACSGWAETQATDRFFDNGTVTPECLLRPHSDATARRLAAHPVVLIAQDTPELDFTAHPPRDARCLNEAHRFGVYAHVHIAITPERWNLGVLGIDYHDRDLRTLGHARERSDEPIENKESFRWLGGYRLACRVAAQTPVTRGVSVADREADLYDIFVEAQGQPAPRADYLVRSRVERCTPVRDPDGGPYTFCQVRDEVATADVLAMRSLEWMATPKRAARTAHLSLRARTVEVKPPVDRPRLPAVGLNGG